MSLAMFEFWMDVQDYRSEPELPLLQEMGQRIYDNFVHGGHFYLVPRRGGHSTSARWT